MIERIAYYNADRFKKILLDRRDSLTEQQKKRVDKLIKKIDEKKY